MKIATVFQLGSIVTSVVTLAMTLPPALAQTKNPATEALPVFRHIDPAQKDPDFKAYPIIRFVVTDDFPPFAYRNKNGALSGFNVAIANTVCKVLRVECRFVVEPFAKARAMVEKGHAEALIVGLVQNSQSEKNLSFTRPYYRFSARFAVRSAAPINGISYRSLAGKRIGVVAASQHETFLRAHFGRSKIRGFKSQNETFEALRTGAVDAVFDDSIKLMFWLKGKPSKDCCKFAGGAYISPQSYSKPMSIAVKRGNVTLLKLLDHALDRLQISGRYNKIFLQYFPLSPWENGSGDS